MKKQKRYLLMCVVAMMLFLTGCGDGLYELTAEEEELVVHSAAYYVAKHNIQQKDGLTGVAVPEEEAESETIESSEAESENTGVVGEAGQGQESTTEPQEEVVSLAEVIGLSNEIQVSYEGSYVANTYMEGSAYIVDAEAGKTFYVMKFRMTNLTNQDVTVNNATKSPIMKLVSDAVTVNSEVTFLTSDFSTYQGTIGAGESVETILLFEVSELAAGQITAPTLQITIGNSTKNIKL